MSCAYERALRVIEKKKLIDINFNRIGTFIVTGSTATRDVRIFPYPSCSCPETKICYHVMAARLACGLANATIKKQTNVTQLRRNARKKADRKSGIKNDVTNPQSIWEDLNGDRCGSDGYDPFYANVASPPRKKITSKSTIKKKTLKKMFQKLYLLSVLLNHQPGQSHHYQNLSPYRQEIQKLP